MYQYSNECGKDVNDLSPFSLFLFQHRRPSDGKKREHFKLKKFVALSYTYYKLLFKKHYSGYVVSWKLKIFNFFLIYTQTCKSTIVEHAQFLTITFVQYLPKTVSSVILFFFILCALVHLFLNQPAMSNNPCFTSESIVLERKKNIIAFVW